MECGEKTFLDSWNWGEFQAGIGNKVWRLGVFKGAKLLSIALVIKISAKRGTFLFVPHAPSAALAKEGGPAVKSEILKVLLEELKKIAEKEKASFIRVSPIWQGSEENIKIFKDFGFRDAPIHMHPELTWELDLTPSEDELLAGMRKTTRYLIRQAQKNSDIKIEQNNTLEGVEKFNKLYQETVDRHHFVPFSPDYLKNQFSAFSGDNQIAVFLGKYKNEIVASAIVVFWQNIAFYHHGASSLKYQKIPVSYLLQWEAVKEAKKRGCTIYNFWGIAPIRIINNQLSIINKNHPWAGLTLFKMGFGGSEKEYVKTQDLPLSFKYWFNYIVEKIRKTKRGL